MQVPGRSGFLSAFVSSLREFFISLHSVLSGAVSPTWSPPLGHDNISETLGQRQEKPVSSVQVPIWQDGET